MKWITLSSNSLVITPLDTNLVSAIIGLYFGGSLVKNNSEPVYKTSASKCLHCDGKGVIKRIKKEMTQISLSHLVPC